MIDEGKKNTAFDLLDAAMELSDLCHKYDVKKSVTIDYHGHYEAFDVTIYDWSRKKKPEIIDNATIYLDTDIGDSFEKAFAMIEKEMEEIRNGRTDG